jgi:predicted HAD superfamily Cof-like phosphohydrolase
MELGATVAGPEEVKKNMVDMIEESKDICLDFDKMEESELIAEQADAFTDIKIFMENAACKKGINLSKIFQIVHIANMNKRFPDGTFHRREEDDKIIKPPNWEAPDVTAEIIDQTKNGNELN